jgi:plastocyanin
MRNRLLCSVAAVLAVTAVAPAARADGWGTVKGQVVWAGGDVPVREKLKVDKDQEACTAHGDLLSEKYVVDPKTKGVRWVVVWLVDPKKPTAALPIAPALKTIKNKKLTLDQPSCMFEPHILALRNGQEVDFKNTAKVPHNINLVKPVVGPNLNQIIPPGGHLLVSSFKPTGSSPVNTSCTIHGWMKGYIWVFRDPYFAVTDAEGNFEIKDAPAGTWNMIVWQEEKGWVGDGGKAGTPVTIKDGATTDVGKIDLKP